MAFGDRNQAGVSVFMTNNEKVANAIRRHSLSRRGVIQETTKEQPNGGVRNTEAVPQSTIQKKVNKQAAVVVLTAEDGETVTSTDKTAEGKTATAPGPDDKSTVATESDDKSATAREHTVEAGTGEPEEREYDNYTVARESICKEFGIKKSEVRNPSTLNDVAKAHGIIIKYKEL